jgi:ABC-type sulfate/molybdate transport systems ATPase subunit
VGQNQAFQSLQKLVIDDVEAKSIGVLGNAGSGKTLILLTLFNSQEISKN